MHQRASQEGIVPPKWIEYGVYGGLIIRYPYTLFCLLKGDYAPYVGKTPLWTSRVKLTLATLEVAEHLSTAVRHLFRLTTDMPRV